MKYYSQIYQLPFDAILKCIKKFELRTNTSYETIDYSKIQKGDQIEFSVIAGPPFVDFTVINNIRLLITIGRVYHFDSARTLFKKKGFKWCSFNPESIDEAVDWIHQILEYEPCIKKHGIYALEIVAFETYIV